MQKDFPKSHWLRRARLAKAVALARKGDFRAAELIVRAEAEYLLSTDRKQQIADIYLEFADALFKPPKERAEARLRQGVGVLSEGVGGWAEAGEADRGGDAGGRMPAASANYPAAIALSRSSSRTSPPWLEYAARNQRYSIFSDDLDVPFTARRIILNRRSRPVSAWASAGWPRAIASRPGASGRTCWRDTSRRRSPTADRRRPVPACPHVEHSQAAERRGIESRRGRAAGVHRAVPHAQAGQPAHLEIAESLRRARPARGRRGRAAAIPGRSALSGPRGNPRRPRICWAAATNCRRSIPRRSRPGATIWRSIRRTNSGATVQREIIDTEYLDGRREIGGQAIRRGQPAVRRVHGEISARRAACPASCC